METHTQTRSLRSTVHMIVGGLLVVVVLSALVTAVCRSLVRGEVQEVRTGLMPSAAAAEELTTAYVNQQTGQRGYLLTGQTQFLAPYAQGTEEADVLVERLQALLAEDETGRQHLSRITEEGAAWRAQFAEPLIAGRDPATPPTVELARLEAGSSQFDRVRAANADFAAYVDARLADRFDRIGALQRIADVAAGGSAVGAGMATVFTVVLLRRRLTRPLDRLVGQVQRVAAEDTSTPVRPEGPAELVRIGHAVEAMRQRLVDGADRIVETERRLAVVEERDRLAADIHDLVIQRVYGLGLNLTGEVARQPDLGQRLDPLIDQTDQVIQDLRTVIFGIKGAPGAGGGFRVAATALVQESSRPLGFVPELSFAGPVDTAVDAGLGEEMLAVLRELLSNVARHASADWAAVSVTFRDGSIRMVVADNGKSPWGDGVTAGQGLLNARQRAERRGGSCDVEASPGGTTVLWQVPMETTRTDT